MYRTLVPTVKTEMQHMMSYRSVSVRSIIFTDPGSSNLYPDFMDPDRTHLSGIVSKHKFSIHHITDNRFSFNPIKSVVWRQVLIS